jgi:hypothetical protein
MDEVGRGARRGGPARRRVRTLARVRAAGGPLDPRQIPKVPDVNDPQSFSPLGERKNPEIAPGVVIPCQIEAERATVASDRRRGL